MNIIKDASKIVVENGNIDNKDFENLREEYISKMSMNEPRPYINNFNIYETHKSKVDKYMDRFNIGVISVSSIKIYKIIKSDISKVEDINPMLLPANINTTMSIIYDLFNIFNIDKDNKFIIENVLNVIGRCKG